MARAIERGFDVVSLPCRKTTNQVRLPSRGTEHSAGYDFYVNDEVNIYPRKRVTVWTDVKARMCSDEVLLVFVRSSVAINQGVILVNGTGVIDSDYYNNTCNDGNIGICLYNTSDHVVRFNPGERICQGIFMKYLTCGDNASVGVHRVGGVGSTNL